MNGEGAGGTYLDAAFADRRRRWRCPAEVEDTVDAGALLVPPHVSPVVFQGVDDLVHRPTEQVDVVEANRHVNGVPVAAARR